MDNQWYFEDHGRAQGPIATRDLVNKIQKKELSLLDLIFKEGDEQWHPVEHFTEITDLLGSVSHREQADWIVLRTREVDGKEKFEQVGPFNTDQIMEMVDKGRISFKDYVWRTGFENWVSLGKVEKFEKPLASSVEVDLSLYKMPRHQMLEKVPPIPVKAYNPSRKTIVKEEAPPPEAAGPDLAKDPWLVENPEPIAPKLVEPVKMAPIPQEPVKAVPVQINTKIEKVAIRLEPKVPEKTEPKIFEKNEPQPPGTMTTETLKGEPLKAIHKITITPQKDKPKIEVKKEPIREDDDLTSEFVPQPSAEAVEKMKNRWGSVWLFVGYTFVICGVALFGIWGYTTKFAKPELTENTIPQQMRESAPGPIAEQLPPPSDYVLPEDEPENPQPVVEQKEQLKKNEKVPKTVSKEKTPPPPEEAVASAEKPEDDITSSAVDFTKMSSKQKAVIHHSERKFIFYTSQKAIRLVNDLTSLYKKKGKNLNGWKSGYSSWQASLKKLSGGELKSSQKRVYPDLFNRLKKGLVSLDNRAKDFNSHLVSGRNPTKELTVSDILAEFQKINSKARDLDQ